MVRYINAKYPYIGTITLDKVDSSDFSSIREFWSKLGELSLHYRSSGNTAYISRRECGIKNKKP